ncbi:MAG: hypothetical protein AABY22_29445 [Nanoarchaeota archaeon]
MLIVKDHYVINLDHVTEFFCIDRENKFFIIFILHHLDEDLKTARTHLIFLSEEQRSKAFEKILDHYTNGKSTVFLDY